MPRKPWIKLSTQLPLSSTWMATAPNKGIVEFILLLTLADDQGIVDKNVVKRLHILCKNDVRTMEKHCRNLVNLHTIKYLQDGSIIIPKFREYQYLQGERTDLKAKPKLPPSEQSRAEQSRTDKEEDVVLVDGDLVEFEKRKPDESFEAHLVRTYHLKMLKHNFPENMVPLTAKSKMENGWPKRVAGAIRQSINSFFKGSEEDFSQQVLFILNLYHKNELIDERGDAIKLYSIENMVGKPELMRYRDNIAGPSPELLAEIERIECEKAKAGAT